MVDGGLPSFDVERAGFEEDVGAGALEPFADVARRLRVRRLRMLRLARPAIVEDRERIQAVGVGAPATAARGDSGEAPAHVVAAAQISLLGDEEPEECA